jgi:hypothetical protein
VRLLDLHARRFVAGAPATSPPGSPESSQTVLELKLRADGALAWVSDANAIGRRLGRELWVGGSGRRATRLDTGFGIVPRSLRLSSNAVGWRNGSAMRSAPLH